MAVVYKCDRCKKIIPPDESARGVTFYDLGNAKITKDACPQCIKELLEQFA